MFTSVLFDTPVAAQARFIAWSTEITNCLFAFSFSKNVNTLNIKLLSNISANRTESMENVNRSGDVKLGTANRKRSETERNESEASRDATRVKALVKMGSETDSEDDNILLLTVLLLKNKKRRRRIWVHDINKKREEHGEYHRLYKELESHEDRFYIYFRMSKDCFEELHEILRSEITKMILTGDVRKVVEKD